MEETQAAVVLFTPNDRVWLEDGVDPEASQGDLQVGHQARPNLLIEADMALAIDEGRTVIVRFGDIRPSTDLDGRHLLEISGNGPEWRVSFKDRLENAGLTVNANGTRWLSAATFS